MLIYFDCECKKNSFAILLQTTQNKFLTYKFFLYFIIPLITWDNLRKRLALAYISNNDFQFNEQVIRRTFDRPCK